MKGIIFNLLEECVREAHGEDAWDKLLVAAELEGAYTSLGSYPDGELVKLVTAAAQQQGASTDEVLRWFGRAAVPLLAEKYPVFFRPHSSTRPLLLTLNTIIHAEVRKLYPGVEVPHFEFDTTSAETLVVEYRSARRLCALAMGMIEGAALRYSERAVVEHPFCRQRMQDACIIHVSFAAWGG